MSEQLPTGIQREKGRAGFIVAVRVRPYPPERKRFPAGTPIATMAKWRAEMSDQLTAARDAAAARTVPTFALDPIGAPRAASGAGATLRDDVDAYLSDDPLAPGTKIDPKLHPHTRLQAQRYLGKAAASQLGRYPRNLIPAAAWAELLASWERNGIPASPELAPKKANGERRRVVPPGPLAPETYNKVRTCWMTFYTALNGTKAANPIRDVPRRDPGQPEARGIPMDQALRIVDLIGRSGKPSRTRARLTLMCVLGLRPCEIMRIKAARDWVRTDRTLVVRTAKGGVKRTLLLGDRATEALTFLDAAHKGWGTFTSAPMSKMFHDAVARAGLTALEPVVPYDLRHSFGTEAYRQTHDLNAVRVAMGHSNIKQTERYTLGAVPDAVANVCQAIDKAAPVAKSKRKRGALHAV